MKILVTGMAGFIGHRVAVSFAEAGHFVVGIDYLHNGHCTQLQQGRLNSCGIHLNMNDSGVCVNSTTFPRLCLVVVNIENKKKLDELFAREHFDMVLHLAAKAGVRDSLKTPYSFFRSNSLGFMNVIEACRKFHVRYLFFASSSSVYGKTSRIPQKENDDKGMPESFYALTKNHNESTARYYSKMYNMCCVGLRFFTVYGPWGRPDMAPMIFANAIFKGRHLCLYGNGELKRDFTYIDDVVCAVSEVVRYSITKQRTEDEGLFDVFNIGTGRTVEINKFVSVLEDAMGLQVKKNLMPMPKGDVCQTKADTSKLKKHTGYSCETTLKSGIMLFVKWLFQYYENITKEVVANKFQLDVKSINFLLHCLGKYCPKCPTYVWQGGKMSDIFLQTV